MASLDDTSRRASHSSENDDNTAGSLAERRALHNSVERTRREALNAKFTYLAQQMPSLSHIHRPSKSVIISHCLDMVVELRDVKLENETLRQEVQYFRSCLAGKRQPSPRQQRSNGKQLPSDTRISPGANHIMRNPQVATYASVIPTYASHPSDNQTARRSDGRHHPNMITSLPTAYSDSAHMTTSWPQQTYSLSAPINHQHAQSVHSQPVYNGMDYSNYPVQVTRMASDSSGSSAFTDTVVPIESEAQLYPVDYAPVDDIHVLHT